MPENIVTQCNEHCFLKDERVAGMSDKVKNLLIGLLKTKSEERLSTGQIINEHLSEEVKAYIESTEFKTDFFECLRTQLYMDEEKDL